MEFIITRTSDDGLLFDRDAIKPIDSDKVYQIEAKLINGHIRKDWAIKINSLEELMEIFEIEKRLVITTDDWYCDNYKIIEIYDDYRE